MMLQEPISVKQQNTRKGIIHSKKAQQRHFETGQLVWLHEFGVCHKLMNKWKGPYRVTWKIDDLIYFGKEDSESACQSLPY